MTTTADPFLISNGNHYDKWFTKFNNTKVYGMTVSVSSDDEGTSYGVKFEMGGKRYSNKLHAVCAVSADGERRLPSYRSEREVNNEVMSLANHAILLMNT